MALHCSTRVRPSGLAVTGAVAAVSAQRSVAEGSPTLGETADRGKINGHNDIGHNYVGQVASGNSQCSQRSQARGQVATVSAVRHEGKWQQAVATVNGRVCGAAPKQRKADAAVSNLCAAWQLPLCRTKVAVSCLWLCV